MKLIVLSLLLLASQSASSAPQDDDVNYLELAALMLQDNNIQRAQVALQQVDLNDENLDKYRYHLLRGLLAYKTNQSEQAILAFDQAAAIHPLEPAMNMYLAQASFTAGQFQRTLQALDAAGYGLTKDMVDAYHLRAQAHWQLHQKAEAIAVMNSAMQRFSNEGSFVKRKILYLIAMELHSQAATLGLEYVQKYPVNATDYLAIGVALKNTDNLQQALKFMESAHLQFPEDIKISKALASIYVSQQHYLSAAGLVHKLAMRDPNLMAETAELYRKAGYLHQALILNGLVTDNTKKLTQRLGLLIELGMFDQATALEEDLNRARISDNDDVNYALAFSFFKLSDYDQAEQRLSRLNQPESIEKALQLRDYMSQCANNKWLCR